MTHHHEHAADPRGSRAPLGAMTAGELRRRSSRTSKRPRWVRRAIPVESLQTPAFPIQPPVAEIADFCRRHQIARLSLFGSVLREDFSLSSDIDVLVEFLPGKAPGFIAFAGMQMELSKILGRTVDLRTPADPVRLLPRRGASRGTTAARRVTVPALRRTGSASST